METPQTQLTPQEVYAAISGAMTVDARTRTENEALLRSWEKDAAPGFLDSLVQIASQTGFIDQELRILAAVVAKNAVGSSWRKTLGSREWSRLQGEEKATIRRRALQCLLEDPSERVAIQMALLIANVARFDFPAEWPSLLMELLEAASFSSRTPAPAKRRALRALKYIVQALRAKRFVAEAPRDGAGRLSRQDLVPLAERIQNQRQQLNQQAEVAFRVVKDMWEQNFAALAGSGPEWRQRGALANGALLVIRELLRLLPSWENVEESVRGFLQSAHAAATATSSMIPSGGRTANLLPGEQVALPDQHHMICFDGNEFCHLIEDIVVMENGGEADERLVLGGKSFERVTQCVMAAMDRAPVDFAAYLPHFLPLYSNNAIFMADMAMVHHIRPKRRVLLMRFLARAVLCPVYHLDWLQAQLNTAIEESQKAEVQEIWPKIAAAEEALNALLTEPQCTRLVESIVSKYLAMTSGELEGWEEDPEQHVRAADVEVTPDADTPRPCGVALLLCMLSRGEDNVATALVQLASKLQIEPRTPEVLLLQEACYRGLGEAFSQLRKLPNISFPDWYASELRGLLQTGERQAQLPIQARALTARAIWLVGICSSELPLDMWQDAMSLVAANLQHADLVICLTAASAIVGMLGTLLGQSEILVDLDALQEHQAAAEQATGRMNLDGAVERLNLDVLSISDQRTTFQAKLELLERQAGSILALALTLEGKLEEIESKVRVLQLVTVLIELLGDKAQPFVGIVADGLPKVWSAARAASTDGKETGAVARLHSALIGVLTHLVDRLGRLATEDTRIAQILPPLLAHSLDLSNPESDTLSEDALKLLRVTLSGCSQLAPQLQALMPNTIHILSRGKESTAALAALEGYVLLSGDGFSKLLEPYISSITIALERCINAAANAIAARDSAINAALTAPNSRQQPAKDIPKETISDAMAACSMCTLLLQLNVAPSVLGSVLRGMAMVLCSKRATELPVNLSDRERNVGSVFEGFLEVLTRVLFGQPQALAGLVGNDAELEGRFVDRWLVIASRKYLGEVLGNPRLASLGRLRRHMVAACLCRIACTQSSRALQDPRRLARALALCLRTVAEREAYLSDQHDMDEVIQQQAEGSGILRDSIMSRRLALTRVDSIRLFDTQVAISEAARAAAAFCPQQELMDQLAFLDAKLPGRLKDLVGSREEVQQSNGHAMAALPGPGTMTL